MGSGGGDQPKFPKEIAQMWGMGHPLASRLAASGMEGYPLWDVPDMPGVPGPVMPSQAWWQGIGPEVKAGLYAPYQEAGKQMTEQMLSMGQGGSQRGGASGALGAGLGTLAAKAGQQVGMQAWQMTAPQMQQYRDEIYGSALQHRGEVMQAQQAPWTLFPSYLGGMGQLPMYQTPNRPSPWLGAAGGAMTGAMAGNQMYPGGYGAAIGGAAGGLYGYYSSR